jgi:excisionase family DNA binding protein
MLKHVSLAVDDIRDQLAKKRKETYTVEEVAELVGRSPYTVRRWIAEGTIVAERVAGTGPKGRLLIRRDQIDRLIGAALGGNVPATATN